MKNAFRTHPRASRIMTGCVAAALIGVATPILTASKEPIAPVNPSVSNQPVENQSVSGELKKGTPDYDTVLPKGKTIKDYGGWTRVSPPNRNPVYAYTDKIGAIPINVSQQPLPKDFSDQTNEQIELLARGYAATKKIVTENAVVYVGTSAKGPQSVIAVKGKLLILIKASAAVPDAEIRKYIQSLS